MSLFDTGIRPAIDDYLQKKAAEKRDYGKYWSASSAGYCLRLNTLKRLNVPCVPEIAQDEARSTRVFEVGHLFHEWMQRITKDAELSVAQELELQDEELLIRGHFDDLVLVTHEFTDPGGYTTDEDYLILYDYKTANSQSFNYKRDEIGHYHKMQLGTYLHMLRNFDVQKNYVSGNVLVNGRVTQGQLHSLSEARILQISKDDLRMREQQLMWTPALKREVVDYWTALNDYWNRKVLPPCTCLDHDGGFMGKRSKKGKVYNNFYFNDEPCSIKWVKQHKELLKGWKVER